MVFPLNVRIPHAQYQRVTRIGMIR
jgi:hypothetical protein